MQPTPSRESGEKSELRDMNSYSKAGIPTGMSINSLRKPVFKSALVRNASIMPFHIWSWPQIFEQMLSKSGHQELIIAWIC